MRVRALPLVLASLLLFGCGAAKEGFDEGLNGSEEESQPSESTTATMSRAELGDEWPLTAESGTVECHPDLDDSVTFTTGGKTYAVNGTARGQKDSQGWEDIDEIWAEDDDPSNEGTKINISPIIDRGLSLC